MIAATINDASSVLGRLGAVDRAGVHRLSGGRRSRRAAAGCGRDHRPGAAAQVRPVRQLRAVRTVWPVRGSAGRVLRSAGCATAARSPASVRVRRRSTAARPASSDPERDPDPVRRIRRPARSGRPSAAAATGQPYDPAHRLSELQPAAGSARERGHRAARPRSTTPIPPGASSRLGQDQQSSPGPAPA